MITLYYAPDNASLIVRILLEEASLPYEAILVDRRTKAQYSDDYLALNPSGLIPTCIIDNQAVFETAAILLSLADTHGKLQIPIDDIQRSQFLKWLFFLSNSLHSDLRQRFCPIKYVGTEPLALESLNSVTLERIKKRLSILDTLYAQSNNTYLFGSEPTIVDIYLAACVRWVKLYPADSKEHISAHLYPAINTMIQQLEQRPAVVAACAKEGITGTFFSDPSYSDPPEGAAT